MQSWYVVYSKSRGEATAHANLVRQGFAAYLPVIRTRHISCRSGALRTTPLFPRYLFVRLNDHSHDWSKIRSTIGVSCLVRFGSQTAKVPNEVITMLRDREDEEGIQTIEPTLYKAGDIVNIVDGPWTGIEAMFHSRSSKDRVELLLELVGNCARLELHANQVEKSA